MGHALWKVFLILVLIVPYGVCILYWITTGQFSDKRGRSVANRFRTPRRFWLLAGGHGHPASPTPANAAAARLSLPEPGQ